MTGGYLLSPFGSAAVVFMNVVGVPMLRMWNTDVLEKVRVAKCADNRIQDCWIACVVVCIRISYHCACESDVLQGGTGTGPLRGT